jgi:hypothetical protein
MSHREAEIAVSLVTEKNKYTHPRSSAKGSYSGAAKKRKKRDERLARERDERGFSHEAIADSLGSTVGVAGGV